MTQRIVLVTGGGRGLGKNAALKLASKGMGIILTWNSNEKEAQQVVDDIRQLGGKAAALPLNVGDISTFPRFVEQMQETLQTQWQCTRFDYLLNNAGIGITAPYSAFTEAQFDQLLNIQFKGPFFLTQSLLPLINQGGRILNVSTGLS
ncbi:MAG: SDR family NAD(P)-dependent oxidoreductase, partial [Citrobacter sp.]|nr:SDR family NAD(P)-dependent oxidoreductase [Citrobacter sp.]